MRLRAAAVAAAAAVMLGLAACGTDDIAEKAVEKATGGDVKLDKNGNKTKIEVGGQTYENTQGGLAEGFPEDVPLPSDFSVQTSTKTGADQYQAYGTVPDGDAAFASLKSDLPAKGWKVQVARKRSGGTFDGTFQIIANKSSHQAIYNSGTANEGATLTVVVGPKT